MKKMIILFILIFTLLILVGCSSSNDRGLDDVDDDGLMPTEVFEVIKPNRKLVYKVRLTIATKNISDVLLDIKSNLNNDEWFETETVTQYHATLIVRVKTERLDQYLDAITEGQNVGNFEKSATDVSTQYQNIETEIESLQLQIERLLLLYENASISEMININQQLSNAQSRLKRLQGELTNFDSLVDYSTVTIYLSTNPKDVEEKNFFTEIKDSFLKGFDVLVSIFRGAVNLIGFMLPISLVAGPIIFSIYKLDKYQRNKKRNKNKKKDE